MPRRYARRYSRSRSRSRSRRRSYSRRSYRRTSIASSARRTRPYSGRRVAKLYTRTPGTVQQGYLPFGVSFTARLPYDEDFAISCPVISSEHACTQWTFNAAGAFRPRVQGGGDQPRMYDQLVLFYDVYQVTGVKVEAMFYNPTRDGFWGGVRVRTGTPVEPPTDANRTVGKPIPYLKESSNCIMKQVNDTGGQKVTMSFFLPLHSMYGWSPERYRNESSTEAGVGQLPSILPRAFIEPFAVCTQADDAAIRCNLKLTYFVKFKVPKTVIDV